MGTYDLEKEIYHILQDSSKIQGYNAKLQSEYINLNDENRQLKVENSKLVSQNTCTEISLAKAKADNFAKSEESDSHVKSGLIGALHGEKHGGLEDSISLRPSGASSLISTSDTALQEKSSMDSKTAICNYCITKHGGIGVAQTKPECFTVNRARLCHNHLAKCPNFREYVNDEEVQKILALSVPEDKKKRKKSSDDDSDEENNISKQRRLSTASSSITQFSSFSNQLSITNFYRRLLSTNNYSFFEIMLLRLIVSNGLSFTFVENEETIAIFQFLAPGIILPK
ncbi:hypothetical protein GLOIN_2v473602 [Rhizophagus clarus]|uniref:Uncharacterized protein n=1 Tax=Rhizophagus clarus TaxID=94130 RepID=A0A8H3QY58_9GLOM|nr:hypothetical protein GLOIN_2v473602 [Rhizophagus clarus]